MQEQTDPQEYSCFSPTRDQPSLIKMNSFIYDPELELKEINEDRDAIQQEYLRWVDIWDNDTSKKQIYIQDLNEHPDNSKQQYQSNQSSIIKNDTQKPSKEPPSEPAVQPKKFLDKSYCRYIVLYIIRTIENKQYAETIGDICSKFSVSYNTFVEYYRKQRNLIMGYKALKNELIYDNDSIPDQKRKKAFKEVLVWYLDKLATKHILLSKKQNFQEYLKYKNHVMSFYVHNPKDWKGNKPQWN